MTALLCMLLLQERSRLEAFLAAPEAGPWILATALGVSFMLGAAHALTPGHGKSIVAAYLVGSRGRLTDAVFLGAVVTATHTFSVFVLGIVTLYASQRVSLDRVYPWLALASGVLVALIGAWLLWKRLTARTHRHDHDHVRHHHAHDHHHDPPTRGSLLSLGVSGGLVPCPEALVVLMISISLRRIGFGLAILVAFSLGLAAVLISFGVAMVLAAPALKRLSGEGPLARALPVTSAVIVTLLGLAIALQAARSF